MPSVVDRAGVTERVTVLEVKVTNIDEKIDDLKIDVKEMHDCLDRTGESIHTAISELKKESTAQHDQLAEKISELEKFKEKWVYLSAGAIAVLGWISAHADTVFKFIAP